jgi:uncharacterized protein GlcG (DUF336 family)
MNAAMAPLNRRSFEGNNMKKNVLLPVAMGVAALSFAGQGAFASCSAIASAWNGKDAQINAVVGQAGNGGYGLPMWVAAVDETGKICKVYNTAGSGATIGNSSWLGSRDIAAQKANTANAFSLDAFAIGTANLYGMTLPGGSLYGLQHSNPIDGSTAYLGSSTDYGTASDPLVNRRIGGVNVFGGGLALYNNAHKKVGALGVSGDTSCTDHAVAWKIRHILSLDSVPAGFVSGYAPAPAFAVKGDEMIIKRSGNAANVQNTYKQVSCAHNAINNPSSGATTGVILEP